MQAPTCTLDARVPVTVGATWDVPLANVPPEFVRRALAELTCEPNKRQADKHPFRPRVMFCLGSVDGSVLRLPPWYAVQALPNAVVAARTLTRGAAMGPGVVFTGTLREHPPQRAAAAAYFGWLTSHRDTPSCILSLPCGYGKTVLCLALLAALGRVALVLAHTNALVDQWRAEARAFLGPAVRIGHIRDGGDVVVTDVDVVIGSLPSVLSHLRRGEAYLGVFLAAVGTVVLDEGHHAVANTFWEVLRNVPAAYRLVLTATPRRRDGLMAQLQWVTGPVVYAARRKVDEVFVVNLCYTGGGHADIVKRGEIQFGAMVAALCEDAGRTDLAVTLACDLVQSQRRRVVVVTPRVPHRDAIVAAVHTRLINAGVAARRVALFDYPAFKAPRRRRSDDVETWKQVVAALEQQWTAARQVAYATWEVAHRPARAALDAAGSSGVAAFNAAMEGVPHSATCDAPLVGCVQSGQSPAERELAFEGHVVVATDIMLEEGVSYKAWDTLITLGNSGDPEQVVGRILRECATKQAPLVIDFWTPVSVFAGLHRKRCKHYAAEDFSQHAVRAAAVSDIPAGFWDRFVGARVTNE